MKQRKTIPSHSLLTLDDARLRSACGGGKRPVSELDPLGTCEESGSGEIVIYRDRYGNIEGTTETHG